jgi:hypothetical protein
MNLLDELYKLAELRREGYLTEEEFAEAKRQLLLPAGNVEPKSQIHSQYEEETEDLVQIEEMTFYSSRLTSGNIFFPDALILESDGIVFQKRSLFGSREEHINYKAVASFRITNGIVFSTISIETSGGSQPIVVNGLWKSEAKEIQDALECPICGTFFLVTDFISKPFCFYCNKQVDAKSCDNCGYVYLTSEECPYCLNFDGSST